MTLAVLARVTLVVGLVASGGIGCRSHAGFRQQYLKNRQDLVSGNWAAAAKKYEASKDQVFRESDRVMYWLNLGTLQHYAEQWRDSQANFVKAERAISDLFTTSITSEASKYTVSETLAPYEGEDFEKILLYFYTAINNVEQGRVRDALVEARRADEFLKKIRVRYDKDEKQSTLYKEDAFMLWLVGLFYEIEGSYNDAFLAYKRSFQVYQGAYRRLFRVKTPTYLLEDIVRTGRLSGLEQDAAAFMQRYGGTGQTAANVRDQAEIIFIHGGGEAPHKRQRNITHKMADGYVARIALPQFEATKPTISRSMIKVGGRQVPTQMAEPVTTIALKNFKHQLPGITARAIARATVKYLATKGTKKAVESGKDSTKQTRLAASIVGLVGNVAAFASENADLRTWSLLPAYFRVARVWVPAGTTSVDVSFGGRGGGGKSQTIPLSLRPGERRIVSLRTVR